MAKRARARTRCASIAGMSIRWMARRISRMAFRTSACRWDWSIGRRGWHPMRMETIVAGVIYEPMHNELFVTEKGRARI